MTINSATINKTLINSLFCKHCIHIDILKEQTQCNQINCVCNENISFSSLLDFYSNLYFHMDNINLVNYETLILFGAFQNNQAIRKEITTLWNSHLEAEEYNSNEHLVIKKSSIELITNNLKESITNEDFLIRSMNWLFVLDASLESFRRHLEGSRDPNINKPFFKTTRGLILFRRKLGLNDYLINDEGLIPPVDPNYLTLRNNIQNFYLAKEKYNYYDVAHLNLTNGTSKRINRENISELKIGFFPGNYKFEDYRWDFDNNSMTDEIYFNFLDVENKDAYHKNIKDTLLQMLEENPDIIIFPELFAPKDLQDEIIRTTKVIKREKKRNKQNLNTFLVLPGSFHIKDTSNKIYNSSTIANGSGQEIFSVNKMNKFKIQKGKENIGILDVFQNKDGIEKCAFDKREIRLIETPIARIAIFICVDLLNFNIEEVLIDRHVDLIFVMTMTNRPASGKFLRRMQELGERNHSTIIICNNLGLDTVSTDIEKKGAYRIVVYFPGLKEPYRSNKEFAVLSIKQMIELAQIS
ncbi:hypothetical protein ABET41_10810 [Metabacillus fastidiosus]|uniref:CN hydrolase domain-containing protein n=1 Tax=Metabacillus fastidiosus TaxID=1458 RepID=A0ABU6NSD1_9BACI|nr:hypothetical protein [Metabacillus fastidiosus]